MITVECATCGKPAVVAADSLTTLLGGSDPYIKDGVIHHHDFNVTTRAAKCEDGHMTKVMSRKECPAEDCGFEGGILSLEVIEETLFPF